MVGVGGGAMSGLGIQHQDRHVGGGGVLGVSEDLGSESVAGELSTHLEGAG
jgi:hypothetical protein